jgi:hypothetical protein
MLVIGKMLPTWPFFFINAYMFSYAQLNLQCVEERMRGLISNLIRLSRQVGDFLLLLT